MFSREITSKWQESYQKEAEVVSAERASYKNSKQHLGAKIFDKLSLIFLLCGFLSLVSVPFTGITLVQATCFFVISFALSPSDGDRYELMMKGIAEDVANLRIHTAISTKAKRKE